MIRRWTTYSQKMARAVVQEERRVTRECPPPPEVSGNGEKVLPVVRGLGLLLHSTDDNEELS
jgi:hypothetical protein